jgi:Na+/H+ antiporter NhaC
MNQPDKENQKSNISFQQVSWGLLAVVAVLFVVLTVQTELDATMAAIIAIAVTFIFRVLTIIFNWRTGAVAPVKVLPESP